MGMFYFQSRELWEQCIPDGANSDLETPLIHQPGADYLLGNFLVTLAMASLHLGLKLELTTFRYRGRVFDT
jgi:hypothetical protein